MARGLLRASPAAAVLFAQVGAAQAGAFVLNAGGELDDESGYRVDAGIVWLPVKTTWLSLQLSQADSSTDLADFVTSHAVASIDHRFGMIGLSLEGRLREEEDFLEARTVAGSIYLDTAGWRFSAMAETRASEFEPQTFSDVVMTRGGVPLTVSATSQCSLDNIAYGVSASYAFGAWRVAGSGLQFDYDDAECALTDVTPPSFERSQRVGPRVLPQVAPRLDAFEALHRSTVTRDSAFLDATVSLSVGYEEGERLWDLTWYRDREQFADIESDTLIGAVTLPLTERTDVELRLGATDSDLAGTVGFAGVSVFLYLGSL